MDMPVHRYHRVIRSRHWFAPGVLVRQPSTGVMLEVCDQP